MGEKNAVSLKVKKDQTLEEAVAEQHGRSEFQSIAVVESFSKHLGEHFSMDESLKVLQNTVKQIQSGDLSKIEEMLISQSIALEQLFVSMARRAAVQDRVTQYDLYMRFALKAQNQSRQTLQALVELKQPSAVTFVKQANIAQGHQQVNNLAEKNPIPQNEVLLSEDNQYASSTMDSRTKEPTKHGDQTLEAVGKFDRSKDT